MQNSGKSLIMNSLHQRRNQTRIGAQDFTFYLLPLNQDRFLKHHQGQIALWLYFLKLKWPFCLHSSIQNQTLVLLLLSQKCYPLKIKTKSSLFVQSFCEVTFSSSFQKVRMSLTSQEQLSTQCFISKASSLHLSSIKYLVILQLLKELIYAVYGIDLLLLAQDQQ